MRCGGAVVRASEERGLTTSRARGGEGARKRAGGLAASVCVCGSLSPLHTPVVLATTAPTYQPKSSKSSREILTNLHITAATIVAPVCPLLSSSGLQQPLSRGTGLDRAPPRWQVASQQRLHLGVRQFEPTRKFCAGFFAASLFTRALSVLWPGLSSHLAPPMRCSLVPESQQIDLSAWDILVAVVAALVHSRCTFTMTS